jgi:hypothetical protein
MYDTDLTRVAGLQLKQVDARKLMNKETIPRLKLCLNSSCGKTEAKSCIKVNTTIDGEFELRTGRGTMRKCEEL